MATGNNNLHLEWQQHNNFYQRLLLVTEEVHFLYELWTRLYWQNIPKLKSTIMHFHVQESQAFTSFLAWNFPKQFPSPTQPRLAEGNKDWNVLWQCSDPPAQPSPAQPSPAQPALNLILLPLCPLTASSPTPWHWNWLGASSHNWRPSSLVIMSSLVMSHVIRMSWGCQYSKEMSKWTPIKLNATFLYFHLF